MKRALTIAISLVLCLTLMACDSPARREAKYMARAQEYFDKGDDVKAGIEYKNVLHINPVNTQALFHLGLIAERQGQYQDAYRFFMTVSEQDQSNVPSRVKLGTLHLIGNELDKAQQYDEAALKLAPRDAEARALKAAILLRHEKLDEARSVAEEVLREDRGNLSAVSVLVGIAYKEGKPKQAVAQVRAAAQAKPNDIPVRLLLARLLANQFDWGGVHTTYEEIFKIAPDKPEYRINLAQTLLQGSQTQRADAVLRQAIKDFPDNDQLKVALADLTFAARGPTAAEAVLQPYVDQNSKSVVLKLKLAELHVRAKDEAGAEKIYTDIIAEDDSRNGLVARQALAELKIRAGDREGAKKLLTDILKRDGENTRALLMRGMVYVQEGTYQLAINDLRASLLTEPNAAPAIKLLSIAYAQTGQMDLAREALQRAVQLDPNDVDARMRLVGLAIRQGNVEVARINLDEVLRRDPGNAQAQTLRGALMLQQKDFAHAEDVGKHLLESPDQKAVGHKLLGGTYLSERKFDLAASEFQKALESGFDVGALQGLAQAQIAGGHPEAAEAALKARSEPEATYLLADLYQRENKPALAEAQYLKLIAAAPKATAPYVALATLRSNHGDTEGAAKILTRGLNAVPGDPQLLFSLGAVRESQMRVDDAIALYRQALAKNPNLDPAINNLVGLIADYKQGDRGQMQDALNMAQRFQNSNQPYYLDTLGWIYFRMGSGEQARALLERAAAGAPENRQIRYHLGMAYFAAGDLTRARRELAIATNSSEPFHGREEAKATLQKISSR